MQAIKDWLNSNGKYSEGVSLYMQHGRNPLLKKVFAETESEYKRQKLKEALRAMVASPTLPKIKPIIEDYEQPDSPSPPENYKYWPPLPITNRILAAMYARWQPLFAEMHNLQARLYDTALLGRTDTNKRLEACQLAHRILELDDLCDEIYQRRNHYYKHGALPGDEIQEREVVGDPVRWVTLLKNAERYVREFRIKLAKEPANEKAAAKLKEHEGTVVHFRKLLKLD